MAAKTKIEWADATWNPVMGCTPLSPGCKNCYAITMMERFGGTNPGYPESAFDVTLFHRRIEDPFRWRKPRTIFVPSMGDLFHHKVPFEFIAAVFGAMAANPRHTFKVLTKRPVRAVEWFRSIESHSPEGPVTDCAHQLLLDELKTHPEQDAGPIHCKWGPNLDAQWPLPNVHLGASLAEQFEQMQIFDLLRCPADTYFVSLEPLLGKIDLTWEVDGRGFYKKKPGKRPLISYLDQVIVGAETGAGARPMDLDWARSLRDQCQEHGVPFFFKVDSEGNHELDGKIWEEVPR